MAEPTEPTAPGAPAPGALLTDEQIKRLRVVVIIMTVLLVAGIALLIGRVIYLASGGRDSGSAAAAIGTQALVPETSLLLPEGASLKSSQLVGTRILAHYAGPRGEGLLVLDLSTGRTLSHVRISR
jgi:hypothetical protein